MPKYYFLFITAGTLLMMIVMAKTGARLKPPTTEYGIIKLELASSKDSVQQIVSDWNNAGLIADAKTNTWCDFGFIFFYVQLLMYGCRIVANQYNHIVQRVGNWLASGAVIAGVLDVLENAGMFYSLQHIDNVSGTVALFTAVCSIIKWVLALSALVYFVLFGAAAIRIIKGGLK